MAEEKQQRSDARSWTLGWREAARTLDRIKRHELREIDTGVALRRLARAFESARIHFKPSNHSGLEEQQRWFRKLRR